MDPVFLHQAGYKIEIGFIVLNTIPERGVLRAGLYPQRVIQAGAGAAAEHAGDRILQHAVDDLQHVPVLEDAERGALIKQRQPRGHPHRVGAELVTLAVQLAAAETHDEAAQAAIFAFLFLPDPDRHHLAEHLIGGDAEILGEQCQIVDIGTRDRFLADDAGRQQYIVTEIGIDLDPCVSLNAVSHDASCGASAGRRPSGGKCRVSCSRLAAWSYTSSPCPLPRRVVRNAHRVIGQPLLCPRRGYRGDAIQGSDGRRDFGPGKFV